MKLMRNSVAVFLLATHLNIMSQENLPGVFSPPPNPCEGIYSQQSENKRPIPYTALREADVAWEKRVWREVDLRERQNQFLYYPLDFSPCRSSLFQALNRGIFSREIVAFADEGFTMPYSVMEVRSKIVKFDTLDRITYDVNGGEIHEKVAVADSTDIARRVLKYRLKEDWFFDKQKSTLEVRIIGIAAYEWMEEKEVFKELYWVYFPACRPIFAATETFNTRNDKEGRSFDEVFMKRQFAGIIVKESNVYDRYINEYAKGIDALTESDNIKMEIFNWEHDLWHF